PHHNRPRPLLFLNFRFQHDRRRAGNAAILADAPEMDAHKDGSDEWNRDAVPNVGTQQSIGVHNRPAEQCESHVVIWSHAEHGAERTFMAEAWTGARHIRTHGDGPE